MAGVMNETLGKRERERQNVREGRKKRQTKRMSGHVEDGRSTSPVQSSIGLVCHCICLYLDVYGHMVLPGLVHFLPFIHSHVAVVDDECVVVAVTLFLPLAHSLPLCYYFVSRGTCISQCVCVCVCVYVSKCVYVCIFRSVLFCPRRAPVR